MLLYPESPIEDNTVKVQAIADGSFTTGPGGIAPSVTFSNAVSKGSGFKLSEHLTREGTFTSKDGSKLGGGSVIVQLTPRMESSWPDLRFNGKKAEIRLGATKKANGEPMALEDFELVFDGLVKKVDYLPGRRAEVFLSDLREKFNAKLSTRQYLGLGGAFPFRGATYLTQAHDPVSMDISGAVCLEWFGVVEDIIPQPANAYTPIVMNGKNGLFGDPGLSLNYALMIKEVAPGVATFAFAGGLDGLSVSEIVDSNFQVPQGVPVYFSASVDPDGVTVSFYGAVLGSGVEKAGEAVLGTPVSAGPTAGFSMGQLGGSKFVSYETRVWSQERTEDEVIAFSTGTITQESAANLPSLREIFRYGEGEEIGPGPERVFGTKGLIDLIPVGDPPEWESSLTGDNPDRFPGGVAGKTKPRVYGFARNIKLTRIDQQFNVFGSDDESSVSFERVKVRGVPMVPLHHIIGSFVGALDFDSITNTITIVDEGLTGNFKKMVQGQRVPMRPGQRILVANTNFNNGVFRIAINGISSSGLSLKVADGYLTNEASPIATAVRTFIPDVQYEESLATSTLRIPRSRLKDLDGDLAADMLGRTNGGGYSSSDLFEIVSGSAPDTSAFPFDPNQGFVLDLDSGVTIKNALDEIARSAFGWWIEDFGGSGYRMGNYFPPTGPSVASINASQFNLTPFRRNTPYWRFNVGYGRIWHAQSGDSLAPSVSQADRMLLESPYSYETFEDKRILEEFETSTEHPGFNTYLEKSADAKTYASLAGDLVGADVRWFSMEFKSLWPLFIQLNDVIEVSWDVPLMRLSKALCRVTGRKINTSNYTMTLEVFTI